MSAALDRSRPSLLTIPVELRHEIYGLLFRKGSLNSSSIYMSLASVCRQLRAEAFPLALQSTSYFSDLQYLIEWTSEGPPALLNHVTDINLTVSGDSLIKFADDLDFYHKDRQEVHPNTAEWFEAQYFHKSVENPGPLNGGSTERGLPVSLSNPSRLFSQPPKTLISQLFEAFCSLPNLIKIDLTLHPHVRQHQKLTNEHNTILSLLSVCSSTLRHLSVNSPPLPLEFLLPLTNLHTFNFSGFSNTPSDEATSILKSLPHLTSLTLSYAMDKFTTRPSVEHPDAPTPTPFLTADTISSLNPLTEFKCIHKTYAAPVADWLIPALTVHIQSLSTFHLRTEHSLPNPMFLSLLTFIQTSKIKDLDVNAKIGLEFKEWESKKLLEYFPNTIPPEERRAVLLVQELRVNGPRDAPVGVFMSSSDWGWSTSRLNG